MSTGAGPSSPSRARRLLLLRHGRTAWNLEGRIQGQTDVPLDEVGLAQAAEVAPVLAKESPVGVWSSDLARARVTAEQVAAACGVEVRTDVRLREFDLGARAGTRLADYAAQNPDEFALYRSGRYEVAPGAESAETVTARFTEALEEVLASLAPGETGVVVAHGAALKTSVAAWLGWPAHAALSLQALGNCHWVEIDDSGPADSPSAGRRLVAYNCHA